MAVAITDPSPARLPGLRPIWHRAAPRRVVEHSSADEPHGEWAAWKKHLAKRTRPAATPFLKEKQPALLWGWPREWQRDDIEALLASPAELAEAILDDAAARPELPLALRIVALAYALPALAGELSPEMWWRLAERLHDLATEIEQRAVDWHTEPSEVVRQQLLAGELPLALGYLFPEVRALRALRKQARNALSEALVEITDGRGLPHARLLPVLGPLFACWTRARWMGERTKGGSWSREAELQYQWLVRQSLRLADKDGRFLLTPHDETAPGWTQSLFSKALELAGDSGDCAAAASLLPSRVVPKRIKFGERDLPNPSLNSDWSGIAVLANGWLQSDVRLAVAYADDPVNIELSAGGERLFAGAWTFDTTCDGALVQVVGEWERLAWESTKRCDFLELAVELSHGLRLERQILFARRDQVLYLADIVVSTDGAPRQLNHSFHLPFHNGIAWRPEVETRDGMIVGRKVRAAVLPLALNEWRSDPRSGSLSEESGRLTLTQAAHGQALCCPLLFDLDRKRVKEERTWRQLTVAEWMEILPRDAAVGFRAQSGRDQWLFYRSLGPAGNRTLLGQNIAGEFSAGPFYDTGKYKEWLEIEAV